MTLLSSLESAIANHIWQSTAFALCMALLTLLLRRNHARIRYGVWLAASAKFLLPLSLFVSIGSHLSRPRGLSETRYEFYSAVNQLASPVQHSTLTLTQRNNAAGTQMLECLPLVIAVLWLSGFLYLTLRWYLRWRQIQTLANRANPLTSGRVWEALERMKPACGVAASLPILSSTGVIEPGTFGILQPILLWPAGITDQLEDSGLDTIMAHELDHVRHRDNLTSAIHMLVEAIFWFHPLVWWMGKRLVDEREQACDESVLVACGHPHIYAESILKVCQFCLESPLQCIAGVTGSDLKLRIVRIMSGEQFVRLSLQQKALIATAGTALLVAPVLFGLAEQKPGQASGPVLASSYPNLPSFEVSSVKPNKSEGQMMLLRGTPSGFIAENMPLRELIRQAYRVQNSQIVGAPGWIDSARFDIEGKVAESDASAYGKLTAEEHGAIMQPILADRFHLKVHTETRDLTVFVLVSAKGGAKLHEATPGDTYVNGLKGPDGTSRAGLMRMGPGELTAQAVSIPEFARMLSQQLSGSIVQDETGIAGNYDLHLQWTPDRDAPAMMGGPGNGAPESGKAAGSAGPSLFTALQEQLGLKLESRKVPVPVLVIDHVEQPSAN
jgi:bla regulator protein blaR1